MCSIIVGVFGKFCGIFLSLLYAKYPEGELLGLAISYPLDLSLNFKTKL
jgi:hypothetical protein